MDKSKLALVGHGVGGIAALYTGLSLQVPLIGIICICMYMYMNIYI